MPCEDAGSKLKPVGVLQSRMSVSAPCEICNTAEVSHTCNRCAQLVCDRHFDEETSYCVDCAVELGRSKDENVPRNEDLPDGVDTYEF